MVKLNSFALNEKQRVKSLNSARDPGTRSDKFLDNITELASQICETPIALISLMDKNRQWLESAVGLKSSQTLHEISFCRYTIRPNELYIVQDATKNPVFRNTPCVTGEPNIRFYAGMPLTDPDGMKLGTLCVIDNKPRFLTGIQKSALAVLSDSIISYLTLQRNKIELSGIAEDFHNLFQNSPDLICTATPDGYFKKISSAFSSELGFSESELLKQPFINLVHPDDQAETIRILSKLNKKGTSVRFFRNRYRCKNGDYLWLSWNATSHNNGQIIATARNITEKIQMEEEIKRLVNEEKKLNEDKILQLSVLTAALSHEMLNPLNMVLGFASVSTDLIDETLGMRVDQMVKTNLTQVRKDIRKIEEHARHMSDVVSNMSSINWNSDTYSGQNSKLNKSFRINRVISECTKLAYSGFKDKNPDFDCEFQYHFDISEPKGRLSVNDFSKSIINLFYNAFEAISNKTIHAHDFCPQVKVKTQLSGNNINIFISNNGISIPPENMINVFNPFFTTKPPGQGSGLGLSISHNILKMHQGSIRIEKSDDLETVFRITLPAGN